MSFKENFNWGTATASYQIEGGAFDDGKGLNIWDTFSHTNGKIFDNHNGDTACDHYHKLESDLDLMKELGIKSYRFSLSWSRIIPNGIGEINPAGIDFYNRLIDGLIARDIKPYMTLYHWDLPYALHLKGGWLNDESSDWFAYYAKCVKEHFGDRVSDFMTFNEPQVFAGCGYYEGTHAPGYKLGKAELLRTGHNVLKAHGKAVMALREGKECRIGLAVSSVPCIPIEESEVNVSAAREMYFQSNHDAFLFTDAYWLDPIIMGRYPQWVNDFKAINAPVITDEDLALISQPIDFIGMNIYNGKYVEHTANGGAVPQLPDGYARNTIGWPLTPEALYWGPTFFHERYGKPIIITENGMACHDFIHLDGKLHDSSRIDYIHRYLKNLKRAAENGVPVDGYFVWSFMDNFEWGHGYKERFGIVFVDYQTQQRTVKDSALWYKSVIETNGENL